MRSRDFRGFPAIGSAERRGRVYGSVCRITELIVTLTLTLAGTSEVEAHALTSPEPAVARALQQTASRPDTATLAGTVVDARTGAPIPQVLVAVEGGPSAETSDDGRFLLRGVRAGPLRLYASAVGYGLAQRAFAVAAGGVVELTIPLSEGAAAYTETVTVSGDRFRRDSSGVPARHALGSAELQNLRGVLAEDALRAVQVLPGVATGDDFRSELSVRGSDFSHLNFTVDGFATPFLMHMVRAVEERANTGSVAMVNGDVLDDVTLQNGGYPQRSGNRTGAELAFTLRQGSRDRRLVRAAISGTSASATAEGPLGGARQGSWLVAARKSYLDLLVDRLSDEGLSFGFADLQAKVGYDLTSRQSASVTVLAGSSRLREIPEEAGDPNTFTGDNASAMAIGAWRIAFERGLLKVAALGAVNEFDNYNDAGFSFERGTTNQFAVRGDGQVRLAPGVELEAGMLVEQLHESQRRQRATTAGGAVVITDYREGAARMGGHALLRLAATARLMLAPGVRIDRDSLTDRETVSPWLQSELRLSPGLALRAAAGLYQQFADIEEVTGALGGGSLEPERAVHADLSLEQRLSANSRLQVTIYNRHEAEMIRRPDADTRLVSGRLVRGLLSAAYANRADGVARGVELLLQRSAPTALSGWLSYAYGRVRFDDRISGERYWGDLDQRHTFNAYGLYRFSHRFSGSAILRMGSNFPIPGYYRQEGDRYFVSDVRNRLRLPSYARLDLRANRTFDWPRRRLTLFIEVLNVLNRENVRFNPPRVSSATREVTRLFDSLVPVVPSAGILFEF